MLAVEFFLSRFHEEVVLVWPTGNLFYLYNLSVFTNQHRDLVLVSYLNYAWRLHPRLSVDLHRESFVSSANQKETLERIDN